MAGPFNVTITPRSQKVLNKELRKNESKRDKVRKAIELLADPGPSYPSLQTHTLRGRTGSDGETLHISYVEHGTPSAWRIYWAYASAGEIAIVYIGPHE